VAQVADQTHSSVLIVFVNCTVIPLSGQNMHPIMSFLAGGIGFEKCKRETADLSQAKLTHTLREMRRQHGLTPFLQTDMRSGTLGTSLTNMCTARSI